MPTTTEPLKPFWQRLVWFVALWAGGVLVLGTIGYAIKLALRS